MNLEEPFMIWNDAEYMLRLLPVSRRAACPADSPRRMGWQTGGCAKEGTADTSSARIGSAQAMRISRNPRLNRSTLQPLELKSCARAFVSRGWTFRGLLRDEVWIVRSKCHTAAAPSWERVVAASAVGRVY
jgi:hypothetical protein